MPKTETLRFLTLARELRAIASRAVKDEAGATAMEYGLITALIATVIISSISNLGFDPTAMFDKIAANLK